MATVRARYEKGVLTPLEPLGLEDGVVVIVYVADTFGPSDKEHDASSAPSRAEPHRSKGLLGIVERVEEIQESMPPEVWDRLPPDGAKNKKHYLYGHPKVAD